MVLYFKLDFAVLLTVSYFTFSLLMDLKNVEVTLNSDFILNKKALNKQNLMNESSGSVMNRWFESSL